MVNAFLYGYSVGVRQPDSDGDRGADHVAAVAPVTAPCACLCAFNHPGARVCDGLATVAARRGGDPRLPCCRPCADTGAAAAARVVARLLAAALPRAGRTDAEILGQLLKGGAFMFGKRVELSWPDGLPDGMTEDDLRRIGGVWDKAPAG